MPYIYTEIYRILAHVEGESCADGVPGGHAGAEAHFPVKRVGARTFVEGHVLAVAFGEGLAVPVDLGMDAAHLAGVPGVSDGGGYRAFQRAEARRPDGTDLVGLHAEAGEILGLGAQAT